MIPGSTGPFVITKNTKIIAPKGLPAVSILQELLRVGAGYKLGSGSDIPTQTITFTQVPNGQLDKEGYTLHVDADTIQIGYADAGGALYAVETLRQLLPNEIEGPKPSPTTQWIVPAIDITDAPRFHWRGMMLDVSRHFEPVSYIKRYLDYLAMEKMNVFHWHLVDDGGWRLQIDAYPKLTQIGAWRYGITTGWDQSKLRFDKSSGLAEYGGYYTKAQVRDVLRYAAARNITIVPEIEMPGHAMPVFAAYPELGCLNQPASSQPGQPPSNVYCAGNPETYKFIDTVLTEVMALFPSKWIHIGGDEVDKQYWHICPRCQQTMKDNGLKNEEELQSFFIRHVDKFLSSHGRRMIGWDEILEGGLAQGATVMSWRGIDGGIAAAKAGHDVVMSPTSHVYFDYPYTTTSTETVYGFNPIPDALSPDEAKHILGAQANEWTEWIPTPQRADYMIWPRMAALAEVVWSPPGNRNYENFSFRLASLYDRLDRHGISYHLDAPTVSQSAFVFQDKALVTANTVDKSPGTLRYMLDGSVPNGSSPAYTGPVEVDKDCDVKFAYVSGSGQAGDIATVSCRKSVPLAVEPTQPGWNVAYYEGEWDAVPDFSKLKPLKELVATSVSIDAKARDENFGLKFDGYFHAQEDGVYTFGLSSDDGSILKIAGAVVVDNDGPHGANLKTGRVRLTAGWHKIEIGYFQEGGAESLKLVVQAPSESALHDTDSLVFH